MTSNPKNRSDRWSCKVCGTYLVTYLPLTCKPTHRCAKRRNQTFVLELDDEPTKTERDRVRDADR